MTSTVIDSTVFRHIFSSEPMRQVFSDEHRVQCYLDIEAALARVQARLGLIPKQVQSISLGTFPRTAKPIRLRFLDIAFANPAGEAKHIYFVPLLDHKSPWLTSVWRLNANTNEWLKTLTKWLAETGATPSPTSVT